mmetsp:Transcript_13744/g.44891  ORF Transcript_13744/g.44891 Transcript_13744/m.44891 type:complete len:248 (+) Transcript_13744:2916-3659(+)
MSCVSLTATARCACGLHRSTSSSPYESRGPSSSEPRISSPAPPSCSTVAAAAAGKSRSRPHSTSTTASSAGASACSPDLRTRHSTQWSSVHRSGGSEWSSIAPRRSRTAGRRRQSERSAPVLSTSRNAPQSPPGLLGSETAGDAPPPPGAASPTPSPATTRATPLLSRPAASSPGAEPACPQEDAPAWHGDPPPPPPGRGGLPVGGTVTASARCCLVSTDRNPSTSPADSQRAPLRTSPSAGTCAGG